MATVLRGVLQTGGASGDTLPLAGRKVVLRSTTAANSQFGQTITDGNGEFEFDYPFPAVNGIYYLQATIAGTNDGEVLLMALLGPTVPERVTINELTTVAAAWSAAQFLSSDATLTGDALPVKIAAGMSANIADAATGASSQVLTSSPNAGETNALGLTRALANLLASSVRQPVEFLRPLLDLATPQDSTNRPSNTIAALANIAKWPAHNAGAIYGLSKAATCYDSPVASQPVAWTIVVKVNDSGDNSMMFGGPGNLAFDARGRAWIGNNVIQGKPDSAPYSIVLDAAGHPAVDDNGQRMTPFTGGGILGAGFGVAVDKRQRVWIGDFGWTSETLPVGSVSLFDSNANALSPSPDGFTAGLNRVQSTVIDGDNNVWMASYGNGAVVIYPGAGGADSVGGQWFSYPQTPDPAFKPFGIAIAHDGTAWVTDSSGTSSGILHLRFTGQGIEKISETRIGKVLKGIVIDSQRKIWVASGGDDTVYRFDENGTLLGAYQGGGIWGPWGICLDGDDNVWVANFGPLEVGSVVEGRLTQLAGTKQSGRMTGSGLTPQTGYTLPSAGSPVLLADGRPLYGHGGPDCYIPMMRTTGLAVDAAGNVWTCNNWKPDFNIDIGDPVTGVPGNPGGDGMLIWVGLAKPVPPA